ncbi:estrogen-related receptor gamma-like isoform X3 [Takifugu flavidus]|uniref:estrogen-related receptor gamma-like isoform X3 n=1 Tax=Takifugu flavidus TaxID=433684 RepID=UPI0025445060|nr:estrogen-related receptor gamma-like isoform X3 [Takifugu flavidus]
MDRTTDPLVGYQCLNSSSTDSTSSLDSASFSDILPSFSPAHAAFLTPSPALSAPSFGLHCGSSLPNSPTGVGGGVLVLTGCFPAPQADSVLIAGYRSSLGPKRVCLVCGELASGYHYGVASCEACKAFFKRTIQGNIKYICPVNNNCEITKRRRKACQACRFQKCLQAGMMREGVRIDRVRGGRQKYRRRTEPGRPYKGPCLHSASSRNVVISDLLLIEPPPMAANLQEPANEGGLCTLLTLCDLLNRQLLLLIGWAKQIPGFLNLSLVDQMSLLQSGWMEVLLVGVAWRSQKTGGEELVFAANLQLTGAQCGAMGLSHLYEALHLLSLRYQLMQLRGEEAVTLKAIALANSDTDPVDCPDSVQRFQDQLHEALQEHGSSHGEHQRAGRLLMTLPLLRQTAEHAVKNLLQLHRRYRVPLHKLLLEMLEAKV